MEIKADDLLDARGLTCPMPIIKAKKAIEKLKEGNILEVLGTDPGSAADFNGWCKQTGHILEEANEIEKDGQKVFQFFIRRK